MEGAEVKREIFMLPQESQPNLTRARGRGPNLIDITHASHDAHDDQMAKERNKILCVLSLNQKIRRFRSGHFPRSGNKITLSLCVRRRFACAQGPTMPIYLKICQKFRINSMDCIIVVLGIYNITIEGGEENDYVNDNLKNA